MSIKIFVLQEQTDQGAFRSGEIPENYIAREFSTDKELALYTAALRAASGLCDHRINEMTDAKVVINRSWSKWGGKGKNWTFEFQTEPEKQAVLSGLEDGDGCVEPLVLRRNDGYEVDYETLAFMIEHSRAPTDDELDELTTPPAAMVV